MISEAVKKSDAAETDVDKETEAWEAGQTQEGMVEEIATLLSNEGGAFLTGIKRGLELRIALRESDVPRLTEELGQYIAEKFSVEDRARLYRRFMIEAKGEYAAHTPGTERSDEESLSYVTKKVIEALGVYAPLYQRKALCKYIKEALPVADAEYDVANEEALFAQLFGEAERGEGVRDIINVLQEVPTDKLSSVKEELANMCDD